MSRITGLSALVKELNAIGKKGEQLVKDEIEATGRDIEVNAKQRAPVAPNGGTLRRSINYSSADNGLTAMVTVNVSYGAYQEFGTGGLVDVPTELREIAEFYKGKGVRKINLRPQPFLYPAYIEGRKQLIENLQKGLVKIIS